MKLIEESNRIYSENEAGVCLAEVTFPNTGEHMVNIDHTFVDNSLRGQGMAGKLMEAAAEKLRRENKKAQLSCSYAMQWFEKHPEFQDLLL